MSILDHLFEATNHSPHIPQAFSKLYLHFIKPHNSRAAMQLFFFIIMTFDVLYGSLNTPVLLMEWQDTHMLAVTFNPTLFGVHTVCSFESLFV